MTRLRHVLSPPRGRRAICLGLHSPDLPLCALLLYACPPSLFHFTSRNQNRHYMRRGGTALLRLKFISRTQPRLSFSKHDLFGFTGQRCKVNLILKICLYHGTSPQMNSKYNEASVILYLKFNPYGLDLYLVCLYTLQKCHEILDLTYLCSQ